LDDLTKHHQIQKDEKQTVDFQIGKSGPYRKHVACYRSYENNEPEQLLLPPEFECHHQRTHVHQVENTQCDEIMGRFAII